MTPEPLRITAQVLETVLVLTVNLKSIKELWSLKALKTETGDGVVPNVGMFTFFTALMNYCCGRRKMRENITELKC